MFEIFLSRYFSIPSFDSNRIKQIQNKKMKSNIYFVFLQSIALQLNNMSKNLQPTDHVFYKIPLQKQLD